MSVRFSREDAERLDILLTKLNADGCPDCGYSGERVSDIRAAIKILDCPNDWHKTHTVSNNFARAPEEK